MTKIFDNLEEHGVLRSVIFTSHHLFTHRSVQELLGSFKTKKEGGLLESQCTQIGERGTGVDPYEIAISHPVFPHLFLKKYKRSCCWHEKIIHNNKGLLANVKHAGEHFFLEVDLSQLIDVYAYQQETFCLKKQKLSAHSMLGFRFLSPLKMIQQSQRDQTLWENEFVFNINPHPPEKRWSDLPHGDKDEMAIVYRMLTFSDIKRLYKKNIDETQRIVRVEKQKLELSNNEKKLIFSHTIDLSESRGGRVTFDYYNQNCMTELNSVFERFLGIEAQAPQWRNDGLHFFDYLSHIGIKHQKAFHDIKS